MGVFCFHSYILPVRKQNQPAYQIQDFIDANAQEETNSPNEKVSGFEVDLERGRWAERAGVVHVGCGCLGFSAEAGEWGC